MKNKNFLFFFISIYIGSNISFSSDEKKKFKESAESFSKNLNISKPIKKSNDDRSKDDSGISNKNTLPNKTVSAKNSSDEKKKFKESAQSFSKNLNTSKKNVKKDTNYTDPFGSLDDSLFSPNPTKNKSPEKQNNVDNKKIIKKKGEDRAVSKKKDDSKGFLSNLWGGLKTGAKKLINSDAGKQIGTVAKDATVSIASTAIQSGNEKLQNSITSINNKISGNSEEIVNAEKQDNSSAEVEGDPFQDLNTDVLTYTNTNKVSDINEQNIESESNKKVENKLQEEVNPQQLTNNTLNTQQVQVSGGGSKGNQKQSKKAKKSKKSKKSK